MTHQIKAHDVVQISPSMPVFGGCFAVVSEVKAFGRLRVYIQNAGEKGQAYVFLEPWDYALCGVAVWVVGGEEE